MSAIPRSNGKFDATGKEFGINGEVINSDKPCPCKGGKSKFARYAMGTAVAVGLAIAGYFLWKRFKK